MQLDTKEFMQDCKTCKITYTNNEKYCSKCGKELSDSQKSYKDLADSFLKFEDLTKFSTKYIEILKSPIESICKFQEVEVFADAIKFFEFGLGIYTMLFLSRVLKFETADLVSNILTQIILLFSFGLSSYLFYQVCKSVSKIKRNFSEYLELFIILYGFLLPLSGIYMYIKHFYSIEVSNIISCSFVLPLWLLIINVWSYFWKDINRFLLTIFYVTSLLITSFLTSKLEWLLRSIIE